MLSPRGTPRRPACGPRRGRAALEFVLPLAAAGCLLACGGEKTEALVCGDADDGELGPNGTLERAPQVSSGRVVRGCVDALGDQDHYLFLAPGHAAGGTLVAELGNLGDTRVQLSFHLQDGGAFIHTVESERASALRAFLAVAPNTLYVVRISHNLATPFPQGGYGYELKLAFQPLQDGSEPNDFPASAKTIGKNRDVKARLFAGYKPGALPAATIDAPGSEAYNDWYKVRVSAGSMGVAVTAVPANIAARVEIQGPDGTPLPCGAACLGGAGQDVRVSGLGVTAGDYLILVTRQAAPVLPAVGAGAELPANFTQDYVLRIEQN